MEFTVGQIAELLGGTVEGNAAAAVYQVAKIEEAPAGSLTFLANLKYEAYLYTTQATAVIVATDLILKQPVAAALIRVTDPYLSFTRLLAEYQKVKNNQRVGVEQPSFMGEQSTIGENHYRGAFSYVGHYCRIGRNVRIYPQAYIGDNVTIGDNTTIGAGSVVTRDIPANVVAVGNPCRVLRELPPAE